MDFYTVSAAPGSYVGISKDGVLYGAGMIDETGTTDIAITPVTSGGNAKIVVTHPQHVPYIAEVPAAAMTGAYISVDAFALSEEQANYGETLDMTIDLKNVGTQPSGALTATLTTDCEYVEILGGSATTAALDPDQLATLTGYQFSVAENVPDKTKAQFVLEVTDGTDTWNSNINITLHAPVLQAESIVVSDTEVALTFKNDGTAPFYGGELTLTSCSPDLVFEPATMTISDVVAGGENVTLSVNYTIDESVEIGTTFEVAYDFTTGMFEISDIFVVSYGSIQEDFESGVFGDGWSFTPIANAWVIVDGGAKGTKCAKSTNEGINSSDYSAILTVNVLAAGDLTFMYKVSSETGSSTMWDNLTFYMDDQQKGQWAGTTMTSFEQFVQPVTTGTHTFKWTYHKDSSVSSGEDCAWIDEITFPPTNVIGFIDPATNLEAAIDGHNVNLTWDASADAVSYVIKRDGETIATVAETSYTDVVATSGTYKYQVHALSSSGAMSAPVSVFATVTFTGVIENQDVNVSVYPNPTEGVLNIVTNANNFEYQVINCVGQVVLNGNANGRTTVNVSELSGVYFLRIIADGDVIVRKVTVK
jgi:hypothetical protein